MHYIIGMVGPSGSGKSTLIQKTIQMLPGRLAILKSITTRPKRSIEDDLFYKFISKDEVLKLEASNSVADSIEYAGNHYLFSKVDIENGLKTSHLICAVVEPAVAILRDQGFGIKAVKITAKGKQVFRGTERRLADQERSQLTIPFDLEIVNDFGTGGLEAAAKKLSEFISSL